ncbi:replication initiation and membrane attachment family protein [Lysinibacillus sphaericus OT4b.31]|uniref:Replication initiation and membrane attachment family protein n=1 Tax=Lysinibacillus sphaericus OT4b.31 TaxID=1285586 RepID=R7ZBN8_LYSSH|nr:replication initiation and membrane attachment family protein [Lysinibacillus sphaericus OT4b.31]
MYRELQPADTFDIRLPHALSTQERQLVTLFYQPLTGAEPISLYLTLWAEAEQMPGQQMSHYYLMNVLGLPIGKVFEARIALEAIGLLRTWKKEEAEQRSFLYELMRPLDADSFMKDPLLSMFLFSKIGEQAYRKLRQRFIRPVRDSEFKDVSRAFIDVFKPVSTNIPTELQVGTESNKPQKVYPFYFEQFDFELLQAGLSDQLVPASLLTLDVREAIAKLAFLYHLTALDMQKVVILALDDDLGISQERLRKAAADFYKLTVSKEPPKLARVYEAPAAVEDSMQKTKDQELQHYLETTAPIQVLRDINNGKEPLQTSVQLAESLIVQHGMPVGVVNALLEYVMLTTDMKLPKKYVETIADHWVRKNIQSAKQAMELARQEHDKYTTWKNKPQTSAKKNTYAKNRREEKVPDWFYKRNDKQVEVQSESAVDATDFEKERLKILEKLSNQQE